MRPRPPDCSSCSVGVVGSSGVAGFAPREVPSSSCAKQAFLSQMEFASSDAVTDSLIDSIWNLLLNLLLVVEF